MLAAFFLRRLGECVPLGERVVMDRWVGRWSGRAKGKDKPCAADGINLERPALDGGKTDVDAQRA